MKAKKLLCFILLVCSVNISFSLLEFAEPQQFAEYLESHEIREGDVYVFRKVMKMEVTLVRMQRDCRLWKFPCVNLQQQDKPSNPSSFSLLKNEGKLTCHIDYVYSMPGITAQQQLQFAHAFCNKLGAHQSELEDLSDLNCRFGDTTLTTTYNLRGTSKFWLAMTTKDHLPSLYSKSGFSFYDAPAKQRYLYQPVAEFRVTNEKWAKTGESFQINSINEFQNYFHQYYEKADLAFEPFRKAMIKYAKLKMQLDDTDFSKTVDKIIDKQCTGESHMRCFAKRMVSAPTEEKVSAKEYCEVYQAMLGVFVHEDQDYVDELKYHATGPQKSAWGTFFSMMRALKWYTAKPSLKRRKR